MDRKHLAIKEKVTLPRSAPSVAASITSSTPCDADSSGKASRRNRWNTAALAFVVLVPLAFNVAMLAPQLRTAPSINDSAWQFALVLSARRALATGNNPFDFWAPELECGFPQFLYYQHLPHLAVVALNLVTFNRVSLIKVFNLVRYLLLVGFPLTVYWSMRTMEFSVTASATGAAFSSLISTQRGMGFGYNNYLWFGYGLYTQLWAMHLLFIATACLQRLLVRGTNLVTTVIACSLLLLSHLFYSYMAALSALVLFLVNSSFDAPSRATWVTRIWIAAKRITPAAMIVAAMTAYFWLPFVLEADYMRQVPIPDVVSTYHPVHTVSATPALRGDLLDYGRPAVLTMMAGLGILAALLRRRSMTARLALSLWAFWTLLYLVLPERQWLIRWLPMGRMMIPLRFIGPVHLSLILLMGLGGEWMWSWFSRLTYPWHAVLPGILMVAVMLPALHERSAVYRRDARYIARFAKIDSDQGWRGIVAALKSQPPGRAFFLVEQGRFRGQTLLERLLLFYDIETLQTSTGLSLNTFAPIQFDGNNPVQYDLFNVRYVIAPRGFQVPWFLTPINSTNDYALYRAATTGYTTFAKIKDVPVPAQTAAQAQKFILQHQVQWLHSPDAAHGTYWRWDYHDGGAWQTPANDGTPGSGMILDEHESPDRIVAHVDCKTTSNLIFKATYHPNWHVTVDGHERPTFMVSPSYFGVVIPAGRHEVTAEYRSSRLKKLLLGIAACTLIIVLVFRRRLALQARIDSLRSQIAESG